MTYSRQAEPGYRHETGEPSRSKERIADHGLTLPILAVVATGIAAQSFGVSHNWQSPTTCLVLFGLMLLLPRRAWRWMLGLALALSVVTTLIALLQLGTFDRPPGPFASPNFLGAYAVLMFFLCCAGVSAQLSAQWLWVSGAAIANLVSLVLSQSRGAILALGAGALVLLWRRLPLTAIGIVIVCIAAALTIRSGYGEMRPAIWSIAWQVAEQRLLTGWGFDEPRFFNTPIQWLVWTGVPGLAAGVWLYVAALRRAWDRPALAAFLVAWLVQGLFMHPVPATLIPFLAVLAYLTVSPRSECSAQPRLA